MLRTANSGVVEHHHPVVPDTTEAVAAVGFTDEEPHALTATDTSPATRPKAIPRRNARPPPAARIRVVMCVTAGPDTRGRTVGPAVDPYTSGVAAHMPLVAVAPLAAVTSGVPALFAR